MDAKQFIWIDELVHFRMMFILVFILRTLSYFKDIVKPSDKARLQQILRIKQWRQRGRNQHTRTTMISSKSCHTTARVVIDTVYTWSTISASVINAVIYVFDEF